jgi:5,6,7,8-tetrahydromethanopterin hydro-lyase
MEQSDMIAAVRSQEKIMNMMIGEAYVGDGAEAAHVILAIGLKGTPFETAFVNTLTQRSKGHITSLALLEPNLPCKPITLIANEITMRTAELVSFFLGPVNAAVANAIVDMVANGTIPKDEAEDLLVIATTFIHWEAGDKRKVYENNLEATKLAIARAFRREPDIDEILRRRETAKHFFYPSPEGREAPRDG